MESHCKQSNLYTCIKLLKIFESELKKKNNPRRLKVCHFKSKCKFYVTLGYIEIITVFSFKPLRNTQI